jgi:hypothetical protein
LAFGLRNLAERLMSPKPVVAPAFFKTQLGETVERRTKVARYVGRAVFVGLDTKTAEENASGAQGARHRLNRLLGFGDMFEDIHCGYEVVFPGGQLVGFQVYKCRRNAACLQAPAGKIEEG